MVVATALAAASAIVVATVVVQPWRAEVVPTGAERADRSPTVETPPRSRTSPPTTAAPTPTTTPGEWDPRLLELVRFIEQERELRFERPIPVELLSDADYEAQAGVDTNTYGFYDGHRVVARGTELTHSLEGTLVHELTHALDDQHFSFGAIEAGAAYEVGLAFNGLVEGDAIRMEMAYDRMLVESGVDPDEVADQPLPEPGATDPGGGGPATTTTTVGSRARPAPAAAVPGSAAATTPATPTATPSQPYGSDIPGLTDALETSPYYVGRYLVHALVNEGGNAAVDAAFRDPPRITEQVLDFRAFLDRPDTPSVEAPVPAAPAGQVEQQTSAGALNLYLVLAAGIDPLQALDAATGWGGEAAVAYDDAQGRSCVDLAVVGDTEADTAEIGDAFTAWAESGVAAQASATVRGDGARVLSACDMGAGSVRTDPVDALIVAEVRGLAAWTAMDERGMDARDAFAVGECLIDSSSLQETLSTYPGIEPLDLGGC